MSDDGTNDDGLDDTYFVWKWPKADLEFERPIGALDFERPTAALEFERPKATFETHLKFSDDPAHAWR